MSVRQYLLFGDEDEDVQPEHLYPERGNRAKRKKQHHQQFIEENEDVPQEWLRYAWQPKKRRKLREQRQQLKEQRQKERGCLLGS